MMKNEEYLATNPTKEDVILTEKNPVLVLRDGRPVACEDCCPCDVYFNAGFSDSDVLWEKCEDCQEKDLAFTHEFWKEKVLWRHNGDVVDGQWTVRINGYHYVIGTGKATDTILGCGGRRHKIEFINGPHVGCIVETTDLWHQGKIDAMYSEFLPDNAVFVKE